MYVKSFLPQAALCSISPLMYGNGYKFRLHCSLEKRLYQSVPAQSEYEIVRSEARTGITLTEQEVLHLNEIVSPLLRKNHSIHHICVTNPDSIMVSESTLYRLVDYCLFDARNVDLPRKVRFTQWKKNKTYKVDKSCRIGRNIQDFEAFMKDHPGLPVTELDSVIGTRGGSVLLTIHFVKTECMLAIKRSCNDSQSVIDAIDHLYFLLGPNLFRRLIPVIRTDNGSEFSNPKAIEYDSNGVRRTSVFYCNAAAPYQKGSCKCNHEFIRMIVPKGHSFDHLSQEQICMMMDHINSYARKSLGDKSPYEMMEFLYRSDILSTLGYTKIPADEINLTPSLLPKVLFCKLISTFYHGICKSHLGN